MRRNTQRSGQPWKLSRRGRGSSVGRARDSWSGGRGFDPRSLLAGLVSPTDTDLVTLDERGPDVYDDNNVKLPLA